MFKKKLISLSYPDSQCFNVKDDLHFRKLICWLENKKIRHYKNEERNGLHNFKSSNWIKFYNQYLSDIHCPHNYENHILVTDWCLSFALRLEYEDTCNSNQVNSLIKPSKNEERIDDLSLNSSHFKEQVYELSEKLKIPYNQDILITLNAILISIKKISDTKTNKDKLEKKNEFKFNLNEISSGYDFNDPNLNMASKLFRLIYINHLRELQTKINHVLVQAQSATANPKTDTSLGKLGK